MFLRSHSDAGHSEPSRPAVCIVHHYYYPQHGHVRRDAEALAGAGYDVTVIALQQEGQARHERINSIEVYRLPLAHQRGSLVRYALEYGRLIGGAFLLLTKLHFQKRFQVIEIDNMPDVLVFGALIPKLMGAKVVLYLFDSMAEIYMLTRQVGPGHPAVRLLALEERISAAFADRAIVPHHPFRETIHAHGVPREKMTVVLNGPDDAIFTPRPPRTPERDDGAFEIVTHGTILERFGIQVLIQALPRILRQVPGARVTVYGEGEYRHALEALARQLGVAERVQFGGWVPVDDLPSVLSRFDVGYVGMLCDNMLSNKLMEYVALRLPVVAARWSTYEHYFDDACVAFFDPGSPDALADTLVRVYHDRAAACQRAERAAERFEQYRWSVQREAYLGVFGELTGHWSCSAPTIPELCTTYTTGDEVTSHSTAEEITDAFTTANTLAGRARRLAAVISSHPGARSRLWLRVDGAHAG